MTPERREPGSGWNSGQLAEYLVAHKFYNEHKRRLYKLEELSGVEKTGGKRRSWIGGFSKTFLRTSTCSCSRPPSSSAGPI